MTKSQTALKETPALPPLNDPNLKTMANAIRALAMDAVEKATSGHPGMPMGMADVATVLYTKFLKFDSSTPEWPDRDRFVLSAGHGSMLIYALNYLTGYKKITLEQIKNFRQIGALTAGHPEVEHDAGIETTTGPLGQGISTAVGMALAERILNARFGNDLVDHYTYVIASDGDLMEGISHEACSFAGHLGLSKLVVLYDDNGISIDGPTSLSFSDDTPKRFESYGWDVQTVDGHNMAEIEKAITQARDTKTPSIICCKTHIGYGAPTKQGSASSHGSPLGAEEIKGARVFHEWAHAPFHVPDDTLNAWREAGKKGAGELREWTKRLDKSAKKGEFTTAQNGDVSRLIAPFIQKLKADFASQKPKHATRQTSGTVLEALVPAVPEMIGGSADLTGSNNTKIKGPSVISANDFSGRYIHYGVREHGMAAAMNGMALHGGVIPYSGTFLVFTDYCRPSIRLSALMQQRVIYVMTHDSIGLGEDGPTHQPVEHVASLRAMPNLNVFRPCDGIETAEAWELALGNTKTPSIMALTRQGLPTLNENRTENLVAKGAYVLRDCAGEPDVTLFASGSEVEIAFEAWEKLNASGKKTRLVSVPCLDLFMRADKKYIQSLTAGSSRKIAIEAGIRMGWDAVIGTDGIFIGMTGFGASGPYQDLYRHFGITAEAVIAAAQ
ncbi:MAG: transketolase [Alphaproteobacteria bacterium]